MLRNSFSIWIQYGKILLCTSCAFSKWFFFISIFLLSLFLRAPSLWVLRKQGDEEEVLRTKGYFRFFPLYAQLCYFRALYLTLLFFPFLFFAHFISTSPPHPWTAAKCLANNFVLNSIFHISSLCRLLRRHGRHECDVVLHASWVSRWARKGGSEAQSL